MTSQVFRVKIPPTVGDFDFPGHVLLNASVTHLDLKGCTNITDASLPIIESLGFLKWLNISGSGISIDSAEKLFRSRRNIEIVLIDNPPRVPSFARPTRTYDH